MADKIKNVFVVLFLLLVMSVAQAQSLLTNQFVILTLDLRQPANSVKVETGMGAEGKYWRIGDGNQDGFTAVKRVAKSEITWANYHLGFVEFKRLHQQAGKKKVFKIGYKELGS